MSNSPYYNNNNYPSNPQQFQPQYPQYQSQQPVQQGRKYENEPMSLGSWIKTYLLVLIPIVGFICTIGWLFGASKFRTRVNFVRANFLIGFVLGGIALVVILALGGLGSIFGNM